MTVQHASELHQENLQPQVQQPANQGLKTRSLETSSSHALNFNLHTQITGGLNLLRGLKNDLTKAFGVNGLRFVNDSGELEIQVLRPFEPAVPLIDLLALTSDLPPATAVLGLTDDGRPLTHSFSAGTKTNILISGQESAGKTTLLRTIAASLALESKQAAIQLLVINPVSPDREQQEIHDSILRPLSYLPHMLTDVAARQTEITELLLFLTREMNFRKEQSFAYPHIVVLIDQAATVMEHGGRTVKQAVQALAERGAQSGIYLVLSTRRPDADVFSPALTANFQTRFIGKLDLDKATEAQAQPVEVEATTLLGEGDFLSVRGSQGHRFQAAYIGNDELQTSLSRLYRQRPILLAQPLDNQVTFERKSKQDPSSVEEQFSFLDELVSME
jgi:DNA segregation ATPase FtsK/SpoIIIE-like protein